MFFIWKRSVHKYGTRWALLHDNREIGCCYYLPGSKQYRCSASAPVKGGAVLFTYYAGTASTARRLLEREWDKRSIGLFGLDNIEFRESA